MNYERSFFLNADSSGLGHNYSPEFASMPPRNDGFENADIMNSIISLPRRTKTYSFLIVWTVENDSKTLVWTRIFVSVFVGSKTEAYKNGLVWT